MPIKCSQVIKYMEKIAPVEYAENWDNVGLMIGDEESIVNKILLALDVTNEVVDEAINNNVDMIITHHPFIFKSFKSIKKSDAMGKKIYKLIENNISVYSAHTNLDSVQGGVNDILGHIIGLEDLEILHKNDENDNLGMGRIGNVKTPMLFMEYVEYIKKALKAQNLKIVCSENKIIKKVGICSGSGIEFLKQAIKNDIDVYITGDIKYHDAIDAKELGANLIDAGHFQTENIILDVLKTRLNEFCEKKIEVNITQCNVNPFS